MIKIKIIIVIISILLILTSCKNNSDQNTNNVNSEKQLSYDEIISKIVKSSNLETKLYPKYFVKTDRIENDSIIIKAYIENNVSDNPKESQIVESAIAWLVLLPEKEKLFDTTSDPENPIMLTFKKELCSEVIKNKVYIDSKNNNSKTTKEITMENDKINFSDVFVEKSTIKFKPTDLEKSDKDIQDFKKRLDIYLEQNPVKENFDIENLSNLINNETFSNAEGYIDSSWLDYFIKKYNLQNYLNDVMKQAINNEDFEAVKVILKNNYVISRVDYEFSKVKSKEVAEIKGRNDVEDYYDREYSKIENILQLVTKKYKSNKIYDKDGYTNIREGKGTNTPIIAKINSGEPIDVLENLDGDVNDSDRGWYLVQTKDSKKGYVHKSRIVSE